VSKRSRKSSGINAAEESPQAEVTRAISGARLKTMTWTDRMVPPISEGEREKRVPLQVTSWAVGHFWSWA
jgi:hypothetical protein